MGLEVREITKKFGEKTAVDHLSFEMEGPGVFGLLGTNGAGKTTTIRMITGILEPDEGDIFIDGKSIKDNPLEAKKNFGFVPDNSDMFLKLK